MAFGLEIKRLREAEKISAKKLADKIGIDAGRLRKWEEKDFDPRDEDAKIIETYFNMSLDQIMKLERLPKFKNVQNEDYKLNDHPSAYKKAMGKKYEMTAEQALLKVLMREFAEYKAEKEGLDADKILSDIRQKAKLIVDVFEGL